MYFRQILHEETSCISYLVGCVSMGACAVIDPQGDPKRYMQQAAGKQLQIAAVIETHIQADHESCAATLAKQTHGTLYFGQGAAVTFPHKQLADGDILAVGNRRIKVIHTPGHTPEHICLFVDGWFVLTGDTLFVGDVGRVDLSFGKATHADTKKRAAHLYQSVQTLLKLPEYTEVYPGHYAGSVCGKGMDGKPISTIGWEKRTNGALQLSKSAFITYLSKNIPPLPADFAAIKKKNMGITS